MSAFVYRYSWQECFPLPLHCVSKTGIEICSEEERESYLIRDIINYYNAMGSSIVTGGNGGGTVLDQLYPTVNAERRL